jgi:hypothetical protein
MGFHQFGTEELDSNSVSSEGHAMVPPVRVGGVENRRSSTTRECDCDELTVAPVELAEIGIVRKLSEVPILIRRDGDPATMGGIGLIVPQPLEEGVTRSWLAGRAQVVPVLLKDQASVVEEQALLSNSQERVDAR